ncbi:MAG: calcium-binding protein [Hyphomicrobiaceae bacterium]
MATLSGTQFQVNAGATGGAQNTPHTTTLSDGRMVYVWRDGGASNSTIVYKVLNIDGSVSVGDTVLNPTQTSSGSVGYPIDGDCLSVAGLDNGGFAVAWEYRNPSDENVFYKVIGANNTVVHDTTQVNAASGLNQLNPDIVATAGGFAIVYTDTDLATAGTTSSSGVMKHLYDNAGASLGASTRVSDAYGGDFAASAAFRPSNGLTVVWDDDLGNNAGSNDGIYGSYSNGSVLFRADSQNLATTQEFHTDPDVAYDGANYNFLTVWSHYNGSGYEVRGKLGTGASASFLISSPASLDPSHSNMTPTVVGLKGSSSYMVFWSDGAGSSTSGGADNDVVGQVVDSSGNLVGGPLVITSASLTNNALNTLDATIMLDGRILVTWEAAGPQSNGLDVYSQIVDPREGVVNFTGTSGNEQYAGTSGDDTINGGGGNDRLYGGDGADTLSDGGGVAFMDGGAGNDTFNVAALGTIVADTGGGIDLVVSLQSFTLAQGVENLVLSGLNGSFGTGNSGANVIFGDASANTLRGLGGADTLSGDEGIDILIGGTGRDVMTGGVGLDDFDFNAISETGKTGSTRDRILDFKHLEDDIDLRDIDAKSGVSGNQAFKFIGTQGFHDVKGELHVLKINPSGTANDKTVVEGDVNGDGRADFQIELKGLIGLTKGDFLL